MRIFNPPSLFGKKNEKNEESSFPIRGVPHLVWFLALFLFMFPIKVESFPPHPSQAFIINPFQQGSLGNFGALKMNSSHRPVSPDHPGELVSITELLSNPSQYHKKIVKVRGTVTQPELHVDESGLFIRFVFVLKGSEHTLIVFGHHDRTQGNIQIETNEQVEVTGIFWKERIANDHQFQNNLEAITVTRYPPLLPHAGVSSPTG